MKDRSSPSLLSALPVLLLILLLAFPGLAVQGASQGLLLWFQVVLPTLAPFMICTRAISAMGGTALLARPAYPLFHALFGLSMQGSCVLLCGLLCGYPLGARLCADFCGRGELSREEAEYLLSICNHPSPMFLLGFAGSRLAVHPLVLPACVYLPLLPLSRLSGHRFFREKALPQKTMRSLPPADALSLEEMILSTAEAMVLIGGCMMLFSILALWIQELPFLPDYGKALLAGAAEITTGIDQLCTVFPEDIRLVPVAAAVSFGGISGIFQTRGALFLPSGKQEASLSAVQKNAGLSIRHYVLWKIVHGCLSCILALAVLAVSGRR
ncbi:MAG: nucleoside recognition protein [Eubacteriales bacterium]|nr:nucleoside recognition protein [Eubacteriales bacterium]